MNENTIAGDAKIGVGKLEGAAGEALGAADFKAKGAGAEIGGHAQKAVGQAQEAIGQVADQARAAVDQAKAVYGRASERAQSVAGAVDPFVQERPYAALGLAALGGLFLGLLLAGRGPKVIYVKPRD